MLIGKVGTPLARPIAEHHDHGRPAEVQTIQGVQDCTPSVPGGSEAARWALRHSVNVPDSVIRAGKSAFPHELLLNEGRRGEAAAERLTDTCPCDRPS